MYFIASMTASRYGTSVAGARSKQAGGRAPGAAKARGRAPNAADPRTSIVEALRKRALLQFRYKGHLRIVAPYCFGTSARGNDVLRAVQVGGTSASNGRGFGKLWTVSEMTDVQMLDETFEPNDPHYNPNDSAMKQIYARI